MTSVIASNIPETLPVTTDQYQLLVNNGTFDGILGQVELIYGKIVRMNPQGPMHSDPIDELTAWSFQHASNLFRVRTGKPIEIASLNSYPEPDIAWVTLRRYADRHPTPREVHLLIEVSYSSEAFDRGEKLRLYAEAGIVEYWIAHVPSQTVEVFTDPRGAAFRRSDKHPIGDEIRPGCLPQATLAVARLFSDQVQ